MASFDETNRHGQMFADALTQATGAGPNAWWRHYSEFANMPTPGSAADDLLKSMGIPQREEP